ncbi:MAG: HU family DNA-binding protein, partial [Clostridiales bacterium]|nr:HU family DNA-binding protein [Clostridiales bacterium]
MNKGEFIRELAARSGLSLKDTAKVFESMVDLITDTLKSGDKIQIAGFGTFELKRREGRAGVNPATGQKVNIPA